MYNHVYFVFLIIIIMCHVKPLLSFILVVTAHHISTNKQNIVSNEFVEPFLKEARNAIDTHYNTLSIGRGGFIWKTLKKSTMCNNKRANEKHINWILTTLSFACISRSFLLARTCMCEDTCFRVLVLPVLNLI